MISFTEHFSEKYAIKLVKIYDQINKKCIKGGGKEDTFPFKYFSGHLVTVYHGILHNNNSISFVTCGQTPSTTSTTTIAPSHNLIAVDTLNQNRKHINPKHSGGMEIFF